MANRTNDDDDDYVGDDLPSGFDHDNRRPIVDGDNSRLTTTETNFGSSSRSKAVQSSSSAPGRKVISVDDLIVSVNDIANYLQVNLNNNNDHDDDDGDLDGRAADVSGRTFPLVDATLSCGGGDDRWSLSMMKMIRSIDFICNASTLARVLNIAIHVKNACFF
jgi:hypothetical protein